MNIAVITGASSGMGREFVLQISKTEVLDEIWVIARRSDRLEELQKDVSVPLRILALDLTKPESFDQYAQVLQEQQPVIRYLVNASGFGKFQLTEQTSLQDTIDMIDLNAKALTVITYLSLPYLTRGSGILQLCSRASFQPVPYMNIYAATKAFVLSYSRALNAELKPRGIRVMAICPFWVQTEFFDHAVVNDSAVTYFNHIYTAREIVKTALKDYKKGKDVSIHGLPVKIEVFLTKLLPHRLVMKIWLRQQKHT